MSSLKHSFLPILVLAMALPAVADEPVDTPAPEPEAKKFTTWDKVGRFGSDAGAAFTVVSVAGIALKKDYRQERLTRSAGAILTTAAITEALKHSTKEERPNKADHFSFPSGHTSFAFSTAALVDAYQPGYKGLAYAAATGIGISRILVKAHYPHDVLAGAAIGVVVTKAFTKNYRGPEHNAPSSLPAAAPGQFLVPHALSNSGGWKVNVSGGRLAIGTSW